MMLTKKCPPDVVAAFIDAGWATRAVRPGAEPLRRAAEILDERADIAECGPWTYDGWEVWSDFPGTTVARHVLPENGEYMTAVSPPVGFAVALMLKVAAVDFEQNDPVSQAALAVADAILASDGIPTETPAELGVEDDAPSPTMGRLPDWCRCPDDCDCDGQVVCGVQSGQTTSYCQKPTGHKGRHVSRNHSWFTPHGHPDDCDHWHDRCWCGEVTDA